MGTFADSFRTEAGPHGVLTFERFMHLALYDPGCGYYRRERNRVGRGGADFYTASSVPLFGELMAEACAELAGGASKAAEYTFVELGVEPGGGVLRGIRHPFKSLREFGVGTAWELAGPCIVFSNELFDAQPFRRFRKGPTQWRELGVKPGATGWEWVEQEVSGVDFLPADAPEGYHLDAPTGARALAESIAAQSWSGLFVAADYGKSWEELAYGTESGTARAYQEHRQTNDLLADPGEQDLTCHVCWDWIGEALSRHGFGPAKLEAQEAFFVKHARGLLAQLTSASSSAVDRRKRDMMQLLHPSLMGRKFQVMTAFRTQ